MILSELESKFVTEFDINESSVRTFIGTVTTISVISLLKIATTTPVTIVPISVSALLKLSSTSESIFLLISSSVESCKSIGEDNDTAPDILRHFLFGFNLTTTSSPSKARFISSLPDISTVSPPDTATSASK